MIPVPLDKISEQDLNNLCTNGVTEGKIIEYKRDIYGGTDGERKEFLADVSSFANTVGGDLIIGIDEQKGRATQVLGLAIDDVDAEIGKYGNIIRDGLEPRITCDVRSVPLSNGRVVLVFRVHAGWAGPHSVSFSSSGKFYARHSTGKYQMDVTELRTAFLGSQHALQQMRNFRTERIAEITTKNTPIPTQGGAAMILHVLPLASFTTSRKVNFLKFSGSQIIRPMGAVGWSHRVNLEGVVSYSGRDEADSYTQLHRNGILESVDYGLMVDIDGQKAIASVYFEKTIIEHFSEVNRVLKETEVGPPYYIFLTLIGVKGAMMSRGRVSSTVQPELLERDIVALPEIEVANIDANPADIMRPIFDMVWNAFGYKRSPHYDNEGRWVGNT